MRILHILDHSLPLHSGYTFRTLSILRAQRARGWETFHITSSKQGSGSAHEEQLSPEWHFFRTPRRHWLNRLPMIHPLGVVADLRSRLIEAARVVRPDLLHAHSPALNGLAALQAGRALGLPVVYEVRAFWEDAAVDHGTNREGDLRYRATRALETHVLRRADAITTICDGLREDMLARGIAAERITVIPNAVNVQDFQRGQAADPDLQAALGLKNATVLGFIGSFYAYEGLDLLLRATPALLRAHPQIKILLVGGGPEEAALKALAHNLGIEGQVVFVGRVPHDQVRRYYDLVDVLVYPRHKMRLTDLVTPLKPLEAMAQERLLLASDVGGHRELIRHGETGALFAADDVDALVRETLALLSAPHSWPMRRAAARTFVEQERNWTASVARYPEVYARAQAHAGKRRL